MGMDLKYLAEYTWAGVLVLFLVIFALGHHLEKRRQAALSRRARRLGLSFYPGTQPAPSGFAASELSARGISRTSSNVLSGSFEGLEMSVFDHRYTTGSGKNRSTHYYSVVWFCLPRRPMPRFQLDPEGWLDKLASAIGFQDIDFREDEGFSSSWRLRGADEDKIRAFFNVDVRHRLRSVNGFEIHGEGENLVLFRSGTLKPDGLEDLLRAARRVAKAFE